MKLISDRQIRFHVYRQDYEDEGFVYVEKWENNRLKDSYFCYAGDIYPDGTVKSNKPKYFFSPYSGEEITKEVKSFKNFKWFDKLYYFGKNGEIYRIDGKPAKDCNYQVL